MNNKFTLGFDDGTSKSYNVVLHWQSDEQAYYRTGKFFTQLQEYIKEVASGSGHEIHQIKSLTTDGEELSVSWDEHSLDFCNEIFISRISECFLGRNEPGYGSNNEVDLAGALSFIDILED
jgi:hypothetical protein